MMTHNNNSNDTVMIFCPVQGDEEYFGAAFTMDEVSFRRQVRRQSPDADSSRERAGPITQMIASQVTWTDEESISDVDNNGDADEDSDPHQGIVLQLRSFRFHQQQEHDQERSPFRNITNKFDNQPNGGRHEHRS
jgi:hypothetical protein